MKQYIIIGNGVAGATSAEKIRSADPEGRITLFSREPVPFYYRVRLPDVVAEQADLSNITIHGESWYRDKRVELYSGESVVEVDTAAGRVRSDKGGEYHYDELLLATGARGFIPPIPGTDKEAVFALRSWADARAIAARAAQIESVVLVGGGLLGLEAGYGLTRRGLQVHVVEFFDRLLPRQMDPAGAAKLQKMLEGMGFSFYLGARAKEIIGPTAAEGLALEDGRTISGGMVLFSAGIRPDLDLAKAMGVETDKGVIVDDRLQTSQANVWAAGDLIEHRGRVYGIWPAAMAQGRIAGTNMAGGSEKYEGTVMSNSLKVVGVDLTSAGNIDADGELTAAIVEDEDTYRKIVVDKGQIAGFIFYGDNRGARECQVAMEKGLDVTSFFEGMKEKNFDFSQM